MARKAINEAKAGYFPTINLNGGWTKHRQAGAMEGASMPSVNSSYFSLGASMQWGNRCVWKSQRGWKVKRRLSMFPGMDYDAVNCKPVC